MQKIKSLKDINLQRHYDPASDGSDLIKDFYIPCLNVSVVYNRISAYFSSAVLRSFCPGLHNLYNNGGKIRFIFSCQLEKADMDDIQNGYKKRMDNMADDLGKSPALLANNFEISNLGYLIEHKLADVKIAFMLKDEASICHIKAGLFEDSFGNSVYFEGSGNETVSGTMRNAENYTVSKSFSSEDQKSDVEYGKDKFNQIWNNEYSSTVRTEFPIGKLFDKLISLSKGKIYNSQQEFLQEQNCVLINVDLDDKKILLEDYTNNHILEIPMVLKTYYSNDWIKISKDIYSINKLSVHDLRDKIILNLAKFKINYILTDLARSYLELNDLELNKRLKLGLAIKENREKTLWWNDYTKFQTIVNNEMVARLKPEQMHNAFYHYEMMSSADFSVPGTGKTYISYGLYAYLSSKNIGQKCNHLVVFGPINCFRAWKDEGKAIFGNIKDLSIFDIQEHKNDYVRILENQKFDVYLFNYDFLGNDSDKINSKLSILVKEILDYKTLLIFDEIHKLKSISGITAKNFVKLISTCQQKPIYRLALTGTPLPNSFVDILNYLKILYSDDIFGTFSCATETKLKIADNNQMVANEIISTILPIFVRTTKKDLHVPPPDPDDFETLKVNPSNDEKHLYELIWKSFNNPLLKYIRLIQASSNPALLKKSIQWSEFKSWFDDDDFAKEQISDDDLGVNSDEIARVVDEIGIASKTKKTIEQIIALVKKREKVLVWCLFTDTINFLKAELEKHGIIVESIYGIDNPKTRDDKLGHFKNGNTQVLITNPNTLAESVSLHMVCHNAIYLEYGFNLTYMLQSKDRINRVGLSPETHTHYYFSISNYNNTNFSSIDQLILNRLKMKADRMLSTIESNKLGIINDSVNEIEDIKYILNKASK